MTFVRLKVISFLVSEMCVSFDFVFVTKNVTWFLLCSADVPSMRFLLRVISITRELKTTQKRLL